MEQELQDLTDKIIKYADRSGVQYCDARAEQQVKKYNIDRKWRN